MSRIVNSTFVSLDGVINHMDRWHFDFVDAESDAIALDQLHASDAMVMGRRTYEIYAAAWPNRDGAYADGINAISKYVASSTLRHPAWTNTTVLIGDLAENVSELKQVHDRDILMHGYADACNLFDVPDDGATVRRCERVAGWGIEHLIFVSSTPWAAADLHVLMRASAAVAGLAPADPARSR